MLVLNQESLKIKSASVLQYVVQLIESYTTVHLLTQ